jgi:hypothetical protein
LWYFAVGLKRFKVVRFILLLLFLGSSSNNKNVLEEYETCVVQRCFLLIEETSQFSRPEVGVASSLFFTTAATTTCTAAAGARGASTRIRPSECLWLSRNISEPLRSSQLSHVVDSPDSPH